LLETPLRARDKKFTQMVGDSDEKPSGHYEWPFCTICLVAAALICHLMVLMGNLQAGAGIGTLGVSVGGWSEVGIGMAESFKGEVDELMTKVTHELTGTVNQIMTVSHTIDMVLSVVGQQTDAAGLGAVSLLAGTGVPTEKAIDAARNAVISELKMFVDKVFAKINQAMKAFLDKLEPALKQVGKWIISFGDKLQEGIEAFSQTIDRVQKIFDQMMEKMATSGTNKEAMMWNTYTLFDTDFDGKLSLTDLKKAAAAYKIPALAGTKSEELLAKYDINKDLHIDYAEYAKFAVEPTLPKVMSVVLRQYSQILASVGSVIGAAKMRDEAAHGVVGYMTLVSQKNRTKISWICQRLTNASIPLAVTSDVLKAFALQLDDPSINPTIDVGLVAVEEMALINSTHLSMAVKALSMPAYWKSEGFDVKDLPRTMKRVLGWSVPALKLAKSGTSLLELEQHFLGEMASNGSTPMSLLEEESLHLRLGDAASAHARVNGELYLQEDLRRRAEEHATTMNSASSRLLFNELLGGRTAKGVMSSNPQAVACVKSGVPAVPATLEFAKYLFWNASRDAAIFNHMSFTYSGQSSSPVDSVATKIKGMIKRVQGFIKALEEYSTPDGIHRLRLKVEDFVVKGEQEIEHIVIKQVNKTLAKAIKLAMKYEKKALSLASLKATRKANEALKLAQLSDVEVDSASEEDQYHDVSALSLAEIEGHLEEHLEDHEKVPAVVLGAFSKIVEMLEGIQAILPVCVANLKEARKFVSALGEMLDGAFKTFLSKGPPVFQQAKSSYDMLWIMYFCLLLPCTLGVLFYGFWASGIICQSEVVDESEPATDFAGQCKSILGTVCFCFDSNNACCGDLCFWSVIIVCQVAVLLLFLVAILLCILAGVKNFIASGCAQIYVLNDDTVCTETLMMLQKFLSTFMVGDAGSWDVNQACVQNVLTSCNEIGAKMVSSSKMTMIGGLFGAVIHFQMLVEASVLHERHRWIVRINEHMHTLRKSDRKEQ